MNPVMNSTMIQGMKWVMKFPWKIHGKSMNAGMKSGPDFSDNLMVLAYRILGFYIPHSGIFHCNVSDLACRFLGFFMDCPYRNHGSGMDFSCRKLGFFMAHFSLGLAFLPRGCPGWVNVTCNNRTAFYHLR